MSGPFLVSNFGPGHRCLVPPTRFLIEIGPSFLLMVTLWAVAEVFFLVTCDDFHFSLDNKKKKKLEKTQKE